MKYFSNDVLLHFQVESANDKYPGSPSLPERLLKSSDLA
jgi:hypothetical protein